MKFFKGLLIGLVLPLWIGVFYASAADVYFFEPSPNANDPGMDTVKYRIWVGDKLDAMIMVDEIGTDTEWVIDPTKMTYGDFIQASSFNTHTVGDGAKNIAVQYLNLNIPLAPGKGGIRVSQEVTFYYPMDVEVTNPKPWWKR